LKNPYLTTNPERAEWFGKDRGEPVVLEVKLPVEDDGVIYGLWWANDIGEKLEFANSDNVDEEYDEDREEQYLLYNGTISPNDIEVHYTGKRGNWYD